MAEPALLPSRRKGKRFAAAVVGAAGTPVDTSTAFADDRRDAADNENRLDELRFAITAAAAAA